MCGQGQGTLVRREMLLIGLEEKILHSRVVRQARLRSPIARPPAVSRLLLAPLPRHRGDFASGDSSITSDGRTDGRGRVGHKYGRWGGGVWE